MTEDRVVILVSLLHRKACMAAHSHFIECIPSPSLIQIDHNQIENNEVVAAAWRRRRKVAATAA